MPVYHMCLKWEESAAGCFYRDSVMCQSWLADTSDMAVI